MTFFFYISKTKKKEKMARSRSGTCFPCLDQCDDDQQGCFEDCAPDDSQCFQVCHTRVNRCILQDCLKGGQCCEEVCQPPTPCEICSDNCWRSYDKCQSFCDPDSENYTDCIQGCEFLVGNCEIDCFESQQCCQEACQGPPGSLKSKIKAMQAPQGQYGIRQNTRRNLQPQQRNARTLVPRSRPVNAPIQQQDLRNSFNPMLMRL